jgi:mannose-6-phosphate isomerase-like protein (cupin superfamily)
MPREVNVMKLSSVGLIAATGVVSLFGQGPDDTKTRADAPAYNVWTPEQLSKSGNLASAGNYAMSVQRRAVGAPAEVHDGFSHILIFTSGEGTFVVGGTLVDGPDGKKIIRGGESHKIVLGEVWHIPIKVPHWVQPTPGTHGVTYFVANINIPKP